MTSLEEFSQIFSTVTEILNDDDELVMIDNIESCIKDAKRVHEEEQIQLTHELERLVNQVESTQKKITNEKENEKFQNQYNAIKVEHQQTLQNITNLQVQRKGLQKQINRIRHAPTLSAKKKEVNKLDEELRIEEQTVRLYMSTFKQLNWDFESSIPKGFVVSKNKETTELFEFPSDISKEDKLAAVDALWELL